MSYLAVENALKRFGPNFTALDGVSISVDRGEFFTLLGTVRLRQDHAAARHRRLQRPDLGRDHGSTAPICSRCRRTAAISAWCFRITRSFRTSAVFDNVAFGLKARKVSKDEIASRVTQALAGGAAR
jgi:ABC-type ATPase involved in cell division